MDRRRLLLGGVASAAAVGLPSVVVAYEKAPLPDLIYRSLGPWGIGKGVALTVEEIDQNFHVLWKHIQEMQTEIDMLRERVP